MMRKTFISALLLFAFCPTFLLAQQIGPKVLNLDDITLEYPRPWNREALVVLDFTVNSDGTVDGIKAVDGFYDERFVEAASVPFANCSLNLPRRVGRQSTGQALE